MGGMCRENAGLEVGILTRGVVQARIAVDVAVVVGAVGVFVTHNVLRVVVDVAHFFTLLLNLMHINYTIYLHKCQDKNGKKWNKTQILYYNLL